MNTSYFSITAGITSFYIYNIQLIYQLINFGSQVKNMIMTMSKFLIKSNGWCNSATTITANKVGLQSIIFNQRFASLGSGDKNSTNKSYDYMEPCISFACESQLG